MFITAFSNFEIMETFASFPNFRVDRRLWNGTGHAAWQMMDSFYSV